VRIRSLRCLREVEVELDPERNYLYGPNGAGKTSFLEALYLLSRGRSFRTRQTKRLIGRDAEALSVFAEVGDTDNVRRMGIEVGSDGLHIKIDRAPAVGTADLARLLRVDIIDPSVHRLIEGGPSERRRFLDWGVFHVEQSFLPAWRRYRRVLGQRNATLKSGVVEAGALEPWDVTFLDAAAEVDAARRRYVETLRPVLEDISARLLGASLEVEYQPGWRRDLELSEALHQSRRRDAQMSFTQVGPHRADLNLRLHEAPLAEQASRGQQKLAAAALVVAQVRVLSGSDDRSAVLLLDDPAAELDRGALTRLLEVVEDTRVQRVFTALSETQLPPAQGFPVFHVEQGRVWRWYNSAV
jgi:DNA replication and repair protein RecF